MKKLLTLSIALLGFTILTPAQATLYKTNGWAITTTITITPEEAVNKYDCPSINQMQNTIITSGGGTFSRPSGVLQDKPNWNVRFAHPTTISIDEATNIVKEINSIDTVDDINFLFHSDRICGYRTAAGTEVIAVGPQF